jgi:hypothetical protein
MVAKHQGKHGEVVMGEIENGAKGGATRAAKLTKERRAQIAKQAAAKRWGKQGAEDGPVVEKPAKGGSLTPIVKLSVEEMVKLFGEQLKAQPISNVQFGASVNHDTRPVGPKWQRVHGCCRIVHASILKPLPYEAPRWAGWRGVPTADGRVFDYETGHQMRNLNGGPSIRPDFGSRLKIVKGR